MQRWIAICARPRLQCKWRSAHFLSLVRSLACQFPLWVLQFGMLWARLWLVGQTTAHSHLFSSLNMLIHIPTWQRRGKSPKSYSTLSVRGSTMRAWLLPESLNLDALLVDTDVEIHHKAVIPQQQQQQGARKGGGGGGGRGRGRRWVEGKCELFAKIVVRTFSSILVVLDFHVLNMTEIDHLTFRSNLISL